MVHVKFCKSYTHVTCQMSQVKCHLSNFTCQMSNVKCQMSNVPCHINKSCIKWHMSLPDQPGDNPEVLLARLKASSRTGQTTGDIHPQNILSHKTHLAILPFMKITCIKNILNI